MKVVKKRYLNTAKLDELKAHPKVEEVKVEWDEMVEAGDVVYIEYQQLCVWLKDGWVWNGDCIGMLFCTVSEALKALNQDTIEMSHENLT